MTTGTATSDFAQRLDKTAEDTEALLGQLLSDTLLPDEIARPKRPSNHRPGTTSSRSRRRRP